MSVNVFIYRLTGGWLGSRMSGQDVLLLPFYFRRGENSLL